MKDLIRTSEHQNIRTSEHQNIRTSEHQKSCEDCATQEKTGQFRILLSDLLKDNRFCHLGFKSILLHSNSKPQTCAKCKKLIQEFPTRVDKKITELQATIKRYENGNKTPSGKQMITHDNFAIVQNIAQEINKFIAAENQPKLEIMNLQ